MKEWLLGGLALVSISVAVVRPEIKIEKLVIFGGADSRQESKAASPHVPAPRDPPIMQRACPHIPAGEASSWSSGPEFVPIVYHRYHDATACVRWGNHYAFLRGTSDPSQDHVCIRSIGRAWEPIWCTRTKFYEQTSFRTKYTSWIPE